MNGRTKTTYGTYPIVLISTKRQLRIYMQLLNGSDGKDLLGNLDGAFKFESGGGVLIQCGITYRIIEDRRIVHRFFGTLHVWAQTENRIPATLALRMLEIVPCKFFNAKIKCQPGAFAIDRSLAFSAAIADVFGVATSCYTHVLMNMKSHVLADKENKGQIMADIMFLHTHVYTDEMMNLLLETTITAWRDLGEGDVADIFMRVYSKEPFNRFYCTACKIPGVSPSSNALELFHRCARTVLGRNGVYCKANRFLDVSLGKITAACPDYVKPDKVKALFFIDMNDRLQCECWN